MIKDAPGWLQEAQLPSKSNEVSFQLSHRVLSQTPRAEAYPLAEGTYPLLAVVTVTEVFLIVGLQAE